MFTTTRKPEEVLPQLAAGARRILFVSAVSQLGGAERSLIDLIQPMRRDHFEPHALVPGPGALASRLQEIGVKVIFCRHLARLSRTYNPGDWLRHGTRIVKAAHAVRSVTCEERIDLVHANTTSAAVHVLGVPGLVTVPTLWHIRDLRLGMEGLLLARSSAGVIAVSRACARVLPRSVHSRIPVEVISSGVSAPTVSGPRRPATPPVIAAVAHFASWKGHDTIVEALRIAHGRGIRLLLEIAGGDPFRSHAGFLKRLQAQIAAAGLEPWVRFLGEASDVGALLGRATCLVHAAYPEPFGRAVVEALSYGCPVVAFAGDHGPSEILGDGVGGVLVYPRTAEALAEAIISLTAHRDDAQGRSHMARGKFERHYQRERTTRRVEAYYRRILAAPQGLHKSALRRPQAGATLGVYRSI